MDLLVRHRLAHAALAIIHFVTAVALALDASPGFHAASAWAAALAYFVLCDGPRDKQRW